jgi:uncharacterized protein (TIGR00255 family)
MKSMTGFACREWAGEDITLSVEIKGYNSRFLEILVNMPPWFSHLEPKIRELVGGYCGRGKVEVSIRLRDHNAPVNIAVNANAAKAYMNAICGLATDLGINEKLSLSVLIGMEGVLEIDKKRDNERYWNLVEPVLRETACMFQAERAREGKQTEDDILNSVSGIESGLKIIEDNIQGLENSIKENIIQRFKELSGNVINVVIDENRILAETAILLMKYTISEEVARLSSHLAEFRVTAKNDKPGKKLDFLCQEINREINTIGSKSAVLEVSRAVVEMKESLENVREQLRNIE